MIRLSSLCVLLLITAIPVSASGVRSGDACTLSYSEYVQVMAEGYRDLVVNEGSQGYFAHKYEQNLQRLIFECEEHAEQLALLGLEGSQQREFGQAWARSFGDSELSGVLGAVASELLSRRTAPANEDEQHRVDEFEAWYRSFYAETTS